MPSNSWTNGWVTGDIPTAAEFAKGVGAIYDSTLTLASATIDITGIVATYAHLMLVLYGRTDQVATSTEIDLRLNNDSAANYDHQRISANAATVAGGETLGGTLARVGAVSGGSAPANAFSEIVVEFAHYASALNHKAFNARGSTKLGTGAGGLFVEADANFWRSTTAINRITLIPAGGNFAAGTRATLYAMGA